MNPVADLTGAWNGLLLIASGSPEAATQFRRSIAGLAIALGWLLLAMLLAAAVLAAGAGLPRIEELVMGLFIQAVTLLALYFVVTTSIGFLGLDRRPLVLLVPMIYAMALMQIAAIPLLAIGSSLQLGAIVAAAALMGRAGMVLGPMKTGNAVAFGFLCLLALVLVPTALYMLFQQIPAS